MAFTYLFPSGYRLIDGNDLNNIFNGVTTVPSLTTTVISSTGAITTSGGLTHTGRSFYQTVGVGGSAYSSTGNNTATVAGTIYWAEVSVDRNFTMTGVGILNGATVGTDKGIVGIYSSSGTLLANSALAGATTSGANAFQQYALTATLALAAPARFWVAYQSNGTTDTIRTVAASTFVNCLTTSTTGAFGTLTALTPPTTFTANVGPIAYVY